MHAPRGSVKKSQRGLCFILLTLYHIIAIPKMEKIPSIWLIPAYSQGNDGAAAYIQKETMELAMSYGG